MTDPTAHQDPATDTPVPGSRVQLPVRLPDQHRRELKSALAADGLNFQTYLAACAMAYVSADRQQRQRVAETITAGPAETAGARLHDLVVGVDPDQWASNTDNDIDDGRGDAQ